MDYIIAYRLHIHFQYLCRLIYSQPKQRGESECNLTIHTHPHTLYNFKLAGPTLTTIATQFRTTHRNSIIHWPAQPPDMIIRKVMIITQLALMKQEQQI